MKSKIALYLIIIIFSAFFLTGCTDQEKVKISENLVSDGMVLYEEREYKKSIEKFTEALEEYPASFKAYLGLTKVLLDKSYFDDVEKLLPEISARLSGEDVAQIYSIVGDRYYEVGDFENAQKSYESALNSNKAYEEAKLGLAKASLQRGEIDSARKALKGGGKSVEYVLLDSYLTLDNWSEGSGKVNDADLNDTEDEKLKERVANLREIYTMDDNDALFKNTSLSGEYVNSGYPFLAIKLLGDSSDKIEEYGDAQYFLGKAYLDYGDYDKAIERLNRAILLEVDDVNAYVALARAYLASKNIEKSLDTYKMAINFVESEESEEILGEYVEVLFDNGMAGVAKTFLLDLLKERESFSSQILLVNVYYHQKDLTSMRALLGKLEGETSITQAETRQLLRSRLLYEVEEIDDVKEVEALIERLLTYDRYNSEAYLFEGKLFKYQQENLKAKEALERAIELDLEGDVADEANKLLATIN